MDFRWLAHKNISFVLYDFDNIDTILDSYSEDEVSLIITDNFFQKKNEDKWDYFLQIFNNLKNKFGVEAILTNILFPNYFLTKEIEEIVEKNFIIVTETQYGNYKNRISIPLIGIWNLEYQIFDNYQGAVQKEFLSNITDDMFNRKFDFSLTLGKPKSYFRILLLLLAAKQSFKKSIVNCSFSIEHHISDNDSIDMIRNHSDWKYVMDKFDLHDEFDKIGFSSYLGAIFSKNKSNKRYGFNPWIDFSSHSDIYVESLTSENETFQKWPNIVVFTEKTFQNFYGKTIPLALDTKTNIDYLKKLGFEFPIPPFYIQDEPLEKTHDRLLEWFDKIAKYDFDKLWHQWMFDDLNSPLHKNFNLTRTFMTEEVDSPSIGFYTFSKLQFLVMYKFYEITSKSMLEEYKNFDYQNYLYFRDLGLIDS